MTLAIPTFEPLIFRAGDTVNWTKSLADFPTSEGWALSYRLINSTDKIDINAVISGDLYSISVLATTTAAYKPGIYTWSSAVTLAAVRHSIASGKVTIAPDLASVTADGYDLRSNARKALDAVNAAMLAHGTNAWTQSYSIAGRSMTFKNVGEFFAFRSKLIVEVRAEENADRILNGEKPNNKLRVRF